MQIAESLDFLSETTGALERQIIPERPFLVLGQYSMTDPTRSPHGTETAWAHTRTG